MSGNKCEWTTENFAGPSCPYPNSWRGGCYENRYGYPIENKYNTKFRGDVVGMENWEINTTFRPILYVAL